MISRLSSLKSEGKRLTNFEMETAGYYAMGKLLGHEMLSLNAIVANRPRNEFDKNAAKTVDTLIHTALELFVA
jgi:uridine phosphorylase